MRKKHREEFHLINNKLKKDFYFENASRELIGFKFENHSAWAIEEYGDPLQGNNTINIRLIILIKTD